MRTLLGLALIVFAVLLFFKNIGIHFSGMLLGNWPIALIVIGGVLLYSGKKGDEENKQTEFLPYFLTHLPPRAQNGGSVEPLFLAIFFKIFPGGSDPRPP